MNEKMLPSTPRSVQDWSEATRLPADGGEPPAALVDKAADEMIERLSAEYDRLTAENARLRAALQQIAGGDPNQVSSPLGPLHAAGIILQWEIDAKIAREALAEQPGENT